MARVTLACKVSAVDRAQVLAAHTSRPRSLLLPPAQISLDRLRDVADWAGEIPNPHPEDPVAQHIREGARAAAVLLPFVVRPHGLRLLVTRRHRGIRFGGHICFPGGRVDPEDNDDIAAALRETEEETGMPAATVDVLGAMGHYYTQTGYRIVPVLGIVREPELARCTDEVEALYELDAARILSGAHYNIDWYASGRGHITYTEGEARVSGPTLSLMTGLHRRLLEL